MRKATRVISNAGQATQAMFAQRSYCLPKFSGIVGRMEDGLDWERLGRYVRAARGPRSQKAIAANNGPSDETISKIERGKWRPSRSVKETLDKLDVGLNWLSGSAESVLRGEEPLQLFDHPPSGGTAAPSIEHPHLHLLGLLWRETSGLVRALVASDSDLELLTRARYMLAVVVDVASEILVASPDAAVSKQFLHQMFEEFFELRNVIDKREAEHVSGDQTETSGASAQAETEEVLANDAERARVAERLQGRFSPNTVSVHDPDDRREER